LDRFDGNILSLTTPRSSPDSVPIRLVADPGNSFLVVMKDGKIYKDALSR